MANKLAYIERVSSKWTEALFVGLTAVFLLLAIWRLRVDGPHFVSVIFIALFIFFLFYSINYRTLLIRIDSQSLVLKFGVFSLKVPLKNIETCDLDSLPTFMKYGGAGIHFMMIRRRYRVSFNFLEHPRVVVVLRRKMGPIREVSFSTRRPDEVARLLVEGEQRGCALIGVPNES